MRRFITSLTLAALLGSGIAPAVRSQTMLDPGAAERLRAAIGRQQSVGGDRYRDPAMQGGEVTAAPMDCRATRASLGE